MKTTTSTNASAVPLARDANSNVISLPDNAAFWGVRRHTGGRPRSVMGLDRRPLRLPLDATLDDLEAMLGPGTYRLDVVDDAGTPLGVTVPVTIGSEQEAGEEPGGAARSEDTVPPMVSLPTSGTDLRLLLEANVRSMQLSFHHNQRTLETSLRVVDSLRDGVRVLADAQAQWIKSLATSQTIRNAPYYPMPYPPRDEDDDDEDEDGEGDDEDDEDYEQTFWEKLGQNLEPYAPLVFETLKHKVNGWVGGKPRNAAPSTSPSASRRERAATDEEPEAPPPAPRRTAKQAKAPSRADLMMMVAQKIGAAKELLSEDEVALLRQLLAEMPADERDRWIAELAPLSVEDAVVRIRSEISQLGVKADDGGAADSAA